MRKSTTALVAVVVTAALAAPVLANGGHGHERKGWHGDSVCRAFEVKGNVTAVDGRTVSVDVERAAPKRLRDKTIKLLTGSRTWLRGTPAAGAVVAASGVVCQVDSADEPTFYAKKLKVKQAESDQAGQDDGKGKDDQSDKAAVKTFEVKGVVTSVSDGTVELKIDRGSPESLVGTAVSVTLADGAKVEGDVEVGATVLAAGWLKVADGKTTYLAKLLFVKEPAPSDDSSS